MVSSSIDIPVHIDMARLAAQADSSSSRRRTVDQQTDQPRTLHSMKATAGVSHSDALTDRHGRQTRTPPAVEWKSEESKMG